jgi:hypothetical protein
MARGRRNFWSALTRLSAYYALLGGGVFGLLSAFPFLEEAFSLARLREMTGGALLGDISVASGGAGLTPGQTALLTAFAIGSAVLLLAPVAWVYMLTRQEKGYDESVVHTVVILPIPIVGLVMVMQNNLALAFGLAGIVAAVRFRNTLDDTKDAVYIFLAIATAFAAGGQALSVAAVTSVVFNYLVLTIWTLKIGNIYADQLQGRTPKMRLGDVLAGAGATPGAGSGNLTIGDPSILAALTPNSLSAIAERKARLREHIESAGKNAKKYNGLLVVLATATEDCLDAINRVLDTHTEQHKLAEITPTNDNNSTLEYLVGIPDDLRGPELIAVLRKDAGEHIVAAEFRNLRLRKSKESRKPHWTLPRE